MYQSVKYELCIKKYLTLKRRINILYKAEMQRRPELRASYRLYFQIKILASSVIWNELGQGNVFRNVCQLFCPQGHLCIMSLSVLLPGPMFLLGGLCPWSHVPSGDLCPWFHVPSGDLCPGGGDLCPGGGISV